MAPMSIKMNRVIFALLPLFFSQVRTSNSDGLRQCYCHDCPNETCTLQTGGWCFAYTIQEDDNPDPEMGLWEFGCLDGHKKVSSKNRHNLSDASFLQCTISSNAQFITPQGTGCCNNYDLCNRDLKVNYSSKSTVLPAEANKEFLLIIITPIACCAAFLTILVCFFLRRQRLHNPKKEKLLNQQNESLDSSKSIHQLIDASTGSGSGLPVLVQRTIAKELCLLENVGKGRFGEVWKASWRGENIAVKIFFSTEEASWKRETDIYQTVLIRHENILGFIASDIKGTGSWTQLMLITDYHPLGSLYEYLKENALDKDEALNILYSSANGLNHLHSDIIGTRGKPAMAHRDVKSRNILVKSSGVCCIADLGLAVKYDSEIRKLDIPINRTRQGTRRYMAPEILNETLDQTSLDAFKQADVYAFALVMWEVFKRVSWNGEPTEACLPYYEYVKADPSIEEMYDVVFIKKQRPKLNCDQTIRQERMSRLISECWQEIPAARLSMLRVKKNIYKLMQDEQV